MTIIRPIPDGNSGAFLTEFLTRHASLQPRSTIPMAAIDECATHPEVGKAIRRAIQCDLLFMSRPMWDQLRQRSDGSYLLLEGSPIRGALPPGEEFGLPVKGYSVPDQKVVASSVTQFITADRVLVLTANTRRDANGLRQLLDRELRPVLDASHQDRFGLLVLMKKGKTTWEAYTRAILRRLENLGVAPEYEHCLI
jgi:hypothetical protein